MFHCSVQCVGFVFKLKPLSPDIRNVCVKPVVHHFTLPTGSPELLLPQVLNPLRRCSRSLICVSNAKSDHFCATQSCDQRSKAGLRCKRTNSTLLDKITNLFPCRFFFPPLSDCIIPSAQFLSHNRAATCQLNVKGIMQPHISSQGDGRTKADA